MENRPELATKEDLAELKAELKQDIAMARSEMANIRDTIIERIGDMVVKVLQGLYAFAEGNQVRITETERESAAFKERIGMLERRLTEIERRVNFVNNPKTTIQ